jgi:predicted ribosome quality control (RQC) complex YloA/Tae2 family protein
MHTTSVTANVPVTLCRPNFIAPQYARGYKMKILHKREVPTRDFTDMTRNELESEWDKTKECFDQALVQKIETDRIYVAAANKLNILERLVKKVDQRAAVASRSAAKYLRQQQKLEYRF